MPEPIQGFDEQALVWIAQNIRSSVLDPIVIFYTKLGNVGLLFIVLTLALLVFKSTRKAGLSSVCAMLIGLVVVNLTVKPLVARPRPWDAMTDFVSLVTEKDFSFPSGHTTVAFAFALTVCLAAPKRWMKITAVCIAVLMGLSRLYVGVHFPTDVLAGAVFGSLSGLAGAWAVKIVWAHWGSRLEKVPGLPPDTM